MVDVLGQWIQEGKPIPPPAVVKHTAVREYGKKFGIKTFIETGTFKGGMVEAVRTSFDRIYSIELSVELYARAQARFAAYPHISILQGHSPRELQKILAEITQPCLFWLDAHYSGGITAVELKQTPILEELEVIFSHSSKDHVIMIDDARCFTLNKRDYPRIEMLQTWVLEKRPEYIFQLEDDIIRIYPHLMPGGS